MASKFEHEHKQADSERESASRQEITSRREFLSGGGLLAGRNPADASDANDLKQSYLLHLTRSAMACDFEVYFNAGQYEQAAESAMEALDLVELLEDQMTVYRHHSQLSVLNRLCAIEPQLVEAR
ncbi:MAG: hypothetical protein ACJZ8O_02710, partial [Pirellulaceae bacterium]